MELWGFFVEQCREHLHVVLCMSPIGEAFRWVKARPGMDGQSPCLPHLHVITARTTPVDAHRERLRQNPSLVNCCTIDWFQPWPSDALEAVASKQLREMDLVAPTRYHKGQLAQHRCCCCTRPPAYLSPAQRWMTCQTHFRTRSQPLQDRADVALPAVP